MRSIHPDHLESVRGGFGALLGPLLQAAPGILQGVAGIIGASKSGKGGGASAPQAAPQEAGPPTQGAAAMAAAASVGVPQQPDPRVSVTVGHF